MAKPTLRDWLLDPFRFVAGGQALALGLAVLAVTIAVSIASGIVLDGILSAHIVQLPAVAYAVIAVADWIALVIVFALAGLVVGRGRFRLLDLAGTLALARAPMLLVLALVGLPPLRGLTDQALITIESQGAEALGPVQLAWLTTLGFATLGLVGWMLWLCWRAFAVSCDARGARAAVGAVVALIVAEILAGSFARWWVSS